MQAAEWLKRNWPLPAAFAIWMLASAYAWWVIDPNSRELRTEWLKTSVQAGGALFLALGLVYTHRTVENSRRTLEHQRESQQETLRHQRKSQQDDRFSKAAELLSNEKSMDARIGALFMLEQLARESDDHYYQVIELICSFIRRRSEESRPSPEHLAQLDPNDLPKAPHDIDVAVRVLGRRKHRFGDGEQQHLDLRRANFCGLYIPDADLAMAVMSGALLIDAHFLRGNLARANLANSDFRHATFDQPLLANAQLVGGRGEDAELVYNVVLADPQHLIPRDIGKNEDHHWVREPARDSLVNGIDYLNESVWPDEEFGGAKLFMLGPTSEDDLTLEMIDPWTFRLNTDVLRGKELPVKAKRMLATESRTEGSTTP